MTLFLYNIKQPYCERGDTSQNNQLYNHDNRDHVVVLEFEDSAESAELSDAVSELPCTGLSGRLGLDCPSGAVEVSSNAGGSSANTLGAEFWVLSSGVSTDSPGLKINSMNI